MPKTKSKNQIEHDVQSEIRIWCGEHNIVTWRINVGSGYTPDGRFFSTGVPEGFPDLEICPGNGLLIYCECKTLTGRQREKQIEFQKQVEADGYLYLMPRSLEQFIEKITPYIKEKLGWTI